MIEQSLLLEVRSGIAHNTHSMPPPLQLRPLTPADAHQYQQLRLRALREHPDAFTSDVEQEANKPLSWSQERLKEGQARFIGIFDAEQLIAMVGLEVPLRHKEAHVGHLVGMYVSQAYIGRGLARRLVQACLDHAGTLGLEAVKLTVTATNERAANLYLRSGFVLYGTEPRAVCIAGRYLDKCLMRYALNRSA
jgi:RimJ/RimL family protein N-acetyltransferase